MALLLATLAVGLAVFLAVQTDAPLDFSVYYMAAYLLSHGDSPYTVSRADWNALAGDLGIRRFAWPYRYPPYTAAFVRVLVPFEPRTAMTVWEAMNAAAALAGGVLVGLALGGGQALLPSLLCMACMGPLFNSLGCGQVEGLAFLGLAAGFWGMARGRDLPLGIGLAAAAALKLTPAALLVYLLWRRRWRPALVAVATLAALTVLSMPFTGVGVFGEYLRRGFSLTEPGLIYVEPYNQSFVGLFGRLFLDSSTYGTFGTANIVRVLALLCSAVVVLMTAATFWPRRRPGLREDPRLGTVMSSSGEGADATFRLNEDLLGYGAVIAVSLIISPFTNYHQFFWLLIPLALLMSRALAARRYLPVALLGPLEIRR